MEKSLGVPTAMDASDSEPLLLSSVYTGCSEGSPISAAALEYPYVGLNLLAGPK